MGIVAKLTADKKMVVEILKKGGLSPIEFNEAIVVGDVAIYTEIRCTLSSKHQAMDSHIVGMLNTRSDERKEIGLFHPLFEKTLIEFVTKNK